MSFPKCTAFPWESMALRCNDAGITKSLNLLKGKANAIMAGTEKFVKAPEPIDFASYRNKLKYTSASVDTVEAHFKGRNIPQYFASQPALTVAKRNAMMGVLRAMVTAAEADLKNQKFMLDNFEENRIGKTTTVKQMMDRFPDIAAQVELEINNREFMNKDEWEQGYRNV